MKIEILGVDKTGILEAGSLNISRITKERRSASFSLFSAASSWLPKAGQELKIYDGNNDLVFGGCIKQVGISRYDSGNSANTLVSCLIDSNGYQQIVERRSAVAAYTTSYAGQIVTNLLATTLNSSVYNEKIGTGTIENGAFFEAYNKRMSSVKDICDDLANVSGFKWYIDDLRLLNFVSETTTPDAAHSLLSTGTFYDFHDFIAKNSLSDYRNVQYVEGDIDATTGLAYEAIALSTAQIAIQQAVEGGSCYGSGIYVNIIRDSSIKSVADALVVAETALKKYGIPQEISFSSYATDWQPSTKLHVKLPKYGIDTDAYYLIEEVILDMTTANELVSHVFASRRDPANFSSQKTDDDIDFIGEIVKTITKTYDTEIDVATKVEDTRQIGYWDRPANYRIKVAAGRFNMSWDNASGRMWVFPVGTVLQSDGTTPIRTSTAEQPDVIIPAGGGYVWLNCAMWNGLYSMDGEDSGVRLTGSLADIPAITYSLDFSNCTLITGTIADLPPLTYYLDLSNCSLISGAIVDLPPIMYYLNLNGCDITGALADLPPLTNSLYLRNCSLITGAITDLPPLTYALDLYNCGNIAGAIADLPALTYYLDLFNCNISGDLSDLPALTYYLNLGGCGITGDLSDLPALTYFLDLSENANITGALSDLPALTYSLNLDDCSNITGALADLPALTHSLDLSDCNLVTGALADLPALTYLLDLNGCTLITGSLADLPAVTYYLDLNNLSLITGSLADLPEVTYFLDLYDCELITGSLADLPPVTYYLNLYDCALVTGSLADLPPLTYFLNLFHCALITGALTDLPALSYYLNLTNCANVTGAYTAVNGSNVPTITYLTGTGLSATDMDNTLIAYAACTKTGGTLVATGIHRTSNSDNAVSHLTTAVLSGGLGWTVSGIIKD